MATTPWLTICAPGARSACAATSTRTSWSSWTSCRARSPARCSASSCASAKPLDEPRDRRGHLVRMLEVRRMPAAHHESLDRTAHAAFDRVDLGERAVLVVAALDEERRRVDPRQQRLEVPVAELRVEPDVAPAGEGRVRVAVMACHALAQPLVLECRSS